VLLHEKVEELLANLGGSHHAADGKGAIIADQNRPFKFDRR